MPNVPTTSWNESSPAGSELMSTVDNRLRELKTQIREVVGVDHDFPSSGQATDNGQHLRVTLQEQADLGTGAVGTTIIGSQTVSGKGELVYTNEDNTDIQMTSGSSIGAATQNIEGNTINAVALVGDAIKIDTNNTYIKSKNAAGSGTVDLIKANASDIPVIPDGAQMATSAAPTVDEGIANKKYVDDSAVGFGSWVNKSGGYAAQQAATDGFVVVQAQQSVAGSEVAVEGYTDSNANPTTLLCRDHSRHPGGSYVASASFTMPVKKNDYWKVILNVGSSISVYWIPLS